MDWLQENLSDHASRLPAPEPDECCNVCNNPSLYRTVPFPWDIAPIPRKPLTGTPQGAFYDRLVLWGDNIVKSAHQMAKPEISVRCLTRKGEWTSLSTRYENICSPAELKEFVKSAWFEDHFDQLSKEFSDIKSYVMRNWPGYGGPRAAAIVQDSEERESLGSQGSLATPYPPVQAQIEKRLAASSEKRAQERVVIDKQTPTVVEQQASPTRIPLTNEQEMSPGRYSREKRATEERGVKRSRDPDNS
jgi:hypothetical protein